MWSGMDFSQDRVLDLSTRIARIVILRLRSRVPRPLSHLERERVALQRRQKVAGGVPMPGLTAARDGPHSYGVNRYFVPVTPPSTTIPAAITNLDSSEAR